MERYIVRQRRYTTKFGVLDTLKTSPTCGVFVYGHDEREMCDWKAQQLNSQHDAAKAREKESKRKESA